MRYKAKLLMQQTLRNTQGHPVNRAITVSNLCGESPWMIHISRINFIGSQNSFKTSHLNDIFFCHVLVD